jgi:asparaginyl-tRNA synthetase
MVEPEIAFATLEDIMDLSERFLCFIVQRVLEKRQEELKILERDISKLAGIVPPFPRLQYDEAVAQLQAGGIEFEYGGDFGAPDETFLSEKHDKPLMVHRYPAQVKAFYMERDAIRPDLSLSVDVLAPEGYGEIIGGGQRMASLDQLREQIAAHELPESAFDWYLDLRKYGSVPHSGFGMGIERCVTWICGIEHLREAIPFPRMIYRLKP